MRRLVLLTSIAVLAPAPVTAAPADGVNVGGRKPQWPLKTSRVLLTEADVDRIRRDCRAKARGEDVLAYAVQQAERWLAFSPAQLRDLLPDSRVPRAFEVSVKGCPIHGTAIYEHGRYPWELDPERRFTVICPIGGERYPSNDFDAYYRSGMRDRSLLTGAYADDGRGWVAPDGEKYWFVAYACHWNWKRNWLRGVTCLSQCYLMTGDRRYGERAVAMLDRIAEIYPGMDYARQSRYGELTQGRYPGKIQQTVWETFGVRDLAIAYDLVFDMLLGGDAIRLPWRNATAIRANIEANLLEEGIDAIAREQILGNWGMHQSALAYLVLIRQHGPAERLLDGIFRQTGGPVDNEGLDYAFYNLVYKDGMPYETSPFYCSSWVNSLVELARPLDLARIEMLNSPRVQRMFDAPLDMLCVGKFTPAIGDAGSIADTWIGPKLETYQQAYRKLGRPRYAWAVDQLGGLRPGRRLSFEELTAGPLNSEKLLRDAQSWKEPQRSRIMDGYGLVVLNNSANTTAVSMYYGVRGSHGHYDRLNIEIFGQGLRLSPDLGYPDQMNSHVPGIFSWTKNTISHNCVVVDDHRQDSAAIGRVLRFHDSPSVRMVDVETSGSYKAADIYRRTLVLVDVDERRSYLVDVFRVRGGQRHFLSLHGNEGEFSLAGTALPDPMTKGTLAGANISYGQMYDYAAMARPGFDGTYVAYDGSGYQHLFNWQRVSTDRPVAGQWRLKGPPPGRLTAHVIPQRRQDIVVADAFVSPNRQIPAKLKYMLVGGRSDLAGTVFVTVWDLSGEEPAVDRVRLHENKSLGTGAEQVIVLSVGRGEAEDVIAVSANPGRTYRVSDALESDAAVVVIRVFQGRAVRTFAAGGSRVSSSGGKSSIAVPASISGKVIGLDYAKSTVRIERNRSEPLTTDLRKQQVRLFNGRHSCIYGIESARTIGRELTLTLSGGDFSTGRLRVKAVDVGKRQIATVSTVPLPFALVGMSVLTEGKETLGKIEAFDGRILQLALPAGGPEAERLPEVQPEQDIWISDFGPGDSVEIEQAVYRAAA